MTSSPSTMRWDNSEVFLFTFYSHYFLCQVLTTLPIKIDSFLWIFPHGFSFKKFIKIHASHHWFDLLMDSMEFVWCTNWLYLYLVGDSGSAILWPEVISDNHRAALKSMAPRMIYAGLWSHYIIGMELGQTMKANPSWFFFCSQFPPDFVTPSLIEWTRMKCSWLNNDRIRHTSTLNGMLDFASAWMKVCMADP